MDLREQKIAFVSGHSGCTKSQLILTLLASPVCSLFYQYLYNTSLFRKVQSVYIRLAIEFIVQVVPILLVITYTEVAIILYVLFLTLSVLAFIRIKPDLKGNFAMLSSDRKVFIDEYRACMMLATCLSILAVDFTIFPRPFAKTETYGVSLMDMGVGSVVFSGAVVSRKARSITSYSETQRKPSRRLFYAVGALKTSLPLVIIGILRLIVTKSTNYQEHVSEYGVHWNFFFTLGFVSLLISLLDIPAEFCGIVGLLIACGYQVALSKFEVADYILNYPRVTLISENKEGLLSIFGYTAIYLLGIQVGNGIFKPQKDIGEWKAFMVKFCIANGIFWLLGEIFEVYFALVSRRMANLSYVLHIVSYNMLLISMHIIFSVFANSNCSKSSLIIASINKNQLFIFLLGNLLTGLANFMFNTLEISPFYAFIIITMYALCLIMIAVLLYKLNIVIKL